jgi:hypothetical protein
MATQTHRDEPILPLLLAWAGYHLAMRLRAMRPALTTEQVATAVALTGNPSGA